MATVAVTAPADARRMSVLGTTNGPAVTDGKRYVAYRARDRRHIVTVDTQTGRQTRFAVSNHCFSPLAISGGRVVVLCMPGHDPFESYPRFFSRQGVQAHTAGIDAYVRRMRTCHKQGCFRESLDIGDAWAKTEWDDGTGSGPTWDFTNLNTGEVRPLSTSPGEVQDIDRTSLTVPLCAPLHRTANTVTSPDRTFDPFVFRSPWAVDTRFPQTSGRGHFELFHCGRKHFVSRSHGVAGAVDLTKRHFAWMELTGTGEVLHAMRLETQRRHTWHMGWADAEPGFSYALTRRWIYAYNPGPNAIGTLMRARLP